MVAIAHPSTRGPAGAENVPAGEPSKLRSRANFRAVTRATNFHQRVCAGTTELAQRGRKLNLRVGARGRLRGSRCHRVTSETCLLEKCASCGPVLTDHCPVPL